MAGDLGAQFGEAGLELLGSDVFAVFGGLADGVSHHVGLLAVDAGLGQPAGDGERVEHGFRVPRRRRRNERARAVGGLLVGVRSGEDDALDGEQSLVDLAELDFDGVQAGVEACVVLAHVGAEFPEVNAKVVDSGVYASDLRRQQPGQDKAGPNDGADDRLRVRGHETQGGGSAPCIRSRCRPVRHEAGKTQNR